MPFDANARRRYPAKVMIRLAILLTLALGAGSALGACGSGPYTGKPEKLKKPRAKKRPEGSANPTEVAGAGGAASTPMSEDDCRTNFFAELGCSTMRLSCGLRPVLAPESATMAPVAVIAVPGSRESAIS